MLKDTTIICSHQSIHLSIYFFIHLAIFSTTHPSSHLAILFQSFIYIIIQPFNQPGSRSAAFQWLTRRLCKKPQLALILPSTTGEGEKHALTGFLVTELPKTTWLLRLLILILLLSAFINPNPGPYTCSTCNHKILRSQASAWCHV